MGLFSKKKYAEVRKPDIQVRLTFNRPNAFGIVKLYDYQVKDFVNDMRKKIVNKEVCDIDFYCYSMMPLMIDDGVKTINCGEILSIDVL